MSINIYNTKAYIKKLAVRPSQTNPNKPNLARPKFGLLKCSPLYGILAGLLISQMKNEAHFTSILRRRPL
jgi:hypothetical protein